MFSIMYLLVKTLTKPSPEIYQNVLSHFEYQPSEAIVFEDSEVGVKAAIDAGINYVLIKKDCYGN